MQDETPRMGGQDVATSHDGLGPQLTLPVRWAAPIFNTSGYASEALNFILPLAKQAELGICHNSTIWSDQFIKDLPPSTRETLHELQEHHPKINGGIFISHNPGFAFQRADDAAYHIGRTMFETDRLPTGWVTACNQMDEIWVPSRFNLETFAASGVARSKLKVIPGAVDESLFDPAQAEPLSLPKPADYNYLSVFEWSSRKGWDVLLAAYFNEFTVNDDVCLWLRTQPFGQPGNGQETEMRERIEAHAKSIGLKIDRLPRFEILTDELPMTDLPRLYKAMDCLVAPSRGEGWGRPQHEAMMMGLPVIATNWSGNTEFMSDDTALLVDYELVETDDLEPTQSHYAGHRWAEPFTEHLRQQMRRVYDNPREGRKIGQAARTHVLKHYSREAVSEIVRERLLAVQENLKAAGIPVPTPEPAETLSVAWEGTFLDYGSLSHVNRNLTGALRQQPGLRLAAIQRTLNTVPPVPEALAPLAAGMVDEAPADAHITVRHGWPPIWEKPKRGKWVLIQPWEFGALPAEWVRELQNVDEAWVPSSYVRDVYIDSGVPANKVVVIPNGIDEKIFRPDAPTLPIKTDKRYKFLFVGGTIGRKGPDILLNTYLETFTADDDVCLVIKDFGGKTFYAGQTMAEVIAEARQQPNSPEIIYIDDDLPPEQVAGLYTACDCLVHPYRGEGFGLPVLEAMACGLPIVCTGGGSTDDFATSDYAYHINAERKSTKPFIGQMLLVKEGWMLEPDPRSLAERMRWVFTHQDKAAEKGRRAAEHARTEWTWTRAAEKAMDRIRALSAGPAGTVDRALDKMRRAAETADAPNISGLLIETAQNMKTPNVSNNEAVSHHIEQADFFLEAGNEIAAIAELEQAQETAPDCAQVIETLGALKYKQGDPNEARALFRRLIELRPSSSLAYTQLAMAAFDLGKIDEFESALGLALELDPENFEALRLLGRVSLLHDRLVEAAHAYRKLIELEPTNVDCLLALAMCLYKGGERDAARATYVRVLEIDQDNLTAIKNLTTIEEMEAANQPIIPTDEDIELPEVVEKALKAAQIAIEHNRMQDAVRHLQDTIAHLPAHPVLLEALANLFVTLEQYDQAKVHALQLAELAPDNILCWIRLGLIAYKQNDIETFEQSLLKALAIDPQNPEALRLLGHANFNVGNYAGAIRQYQQVLQRQPEDVEVLQAMGVCLHRSGKPKDAKKLFERVLELEPRNRIAQNNLLASESNGVAELKKRAAKNWNGKPATNGKPEVSNGHPIPTQSLEIPEPRTHVGIQTGGEMREFELPQVAQLGNLQTAAELAQAGKHTEAAQACNEAIALRPFHPDAYYYLAQVALDAGDEKHALECLTRVTGLCPEWADAAALKKSLEAKAALETTEIHWPDLPLLPEQSRLTVCMIVKDEEETLGRALESVKDLAHQVVVVDTGSTDRTVAIACEHGAEAHHFEWNDNFSDARNFSLQHARGDWILVLDADEELLAGTRADLAADLTSANVLGQRIPLLNKQTADTGASLVPRLFRNAPGICFIGRVHEQAFSSVLAQGRRWGMGLGIGKATLMHHGYSAEIKQSKDKVKRNLRLLELALEEFPDEPALLMNHGLDLYNDGQVEKAIGQLGCAAAEMEKMEPAAVLPEVRERLVNTYASILLQAEETGKLVEFAQSRVALASGPTASLHYLHGLALLKSSRSTEAIPEFQACIAKAGQPVMAPACRGVQKAGPHHLLGDCLARDGRAEEAEEQYRMGIELEPTNVPIRLDYAKFLVTQHRPTEALNVLHNRIEEHGPDEKLWALGCQIVNGHLEDFEVAANWTECAMLHYPDHAEIRKHRAIALLTAGRFDEAVEYFEQTPGLENEMTTAAIYLCRITSDHAKKLKTPENELAISKYLTDWYRRLLTHDNEPATQAVIARLDALERLLPTAARILREAAMV